MRSRRRRAAFSRWLNEPCGSIGDATRLLPDALPLTLGQLAYVLGGEPDLGLHFRKVLENGAWFTGPFAAIVDAFAAARNPSAHGEGVPREIVVHWRNQLLGVGGESVMAQLAMVRVR